jgi:hypothetical protein
MAPQKETVAPAEAPKPRKSAADVALEKAMKASASAAEARVKAQWLTVVSELHSALGHAEGREAAATLSMIDGARSRLLEIAPELDKHDAADADES